MRVSVTLHPRIHLSLEPHTGVGVGAEGQGLEEQGLMGNHPTLDPHAPRPTCSHQQTQLSASSQGGRQPAETAGSSRKAQGTRTDLVPWTQQTCAHASHEVGQARAGAATWTLLGKPLPFLPPSGTQHPGTCAPP